MDIPTQSELLTKIEAFCLRHELAETRFGRDAVSNPNFIRGLRDGVSPTLDTLSKVSAYMARTDAEAATRAKLAAPLPPSQEVEEPLPFGAAPADQAGAISPTSSSTTAPPTQPPASAPSRSSSDSPLLAAPSAPLVAGGARDAA